MLRSGCRAMWWVAKGLEVTSARTAQQRALLKIAVATLLLISTMVGTAAACPHGDRGAQSIVANYKTEGAFAAVIVSAIPSRIVTTPDCSDNGPCCGAGCHSHGVACASGWCFAGFGSIYFVGSNLFLPATSLRLLPLDQAEAMSTRPPPNFRPPRSFS